VHLGWGWVGQCCVRYHRQAVVAGLLGVVYHHRLCTDYSIALATSICIDNDSDHDGCRLWRARFSNKIFVVCLCSTR
jgi:hypothetical protein